MRRNGRGRDSSQKQAAILALDFDVLGEDEAREAEAALDTEARAELPGLRDTVSRLAFVSAKTPPAGLRRELLKTLQPQQGQEGPQVWKSWTADAGAALHVVRSDEGNWQHVVEGVQAKRLFADPVRDSVTMLIRMAPGSEYPAHRHGGNEECLVLEGDVEVGDVVLHAGDYQCARTSSIHDVTRTVNGCLLLIVSSMHDQLLA
jgi:hypothetical protein